MAKKRQYYYLVVFYKVEKGTPAVTEWNVSTYLCNTNENNPAGIPTMGYLIRHAKADAERNGGKYVHDSLYIQCMIKLTKTQYEYLMDREETDEEK